MYRVHAWCLRCMVRLHRLSNDTIRTHLSTGYVRISSTWLSTLYSDPGAPTVSRNRLHTQSCACARIMSCLLSCANLCSCASGNASHAMLLSTCALQLLIFTLATVSVSTKLSQYRRRSSFTWLKYRVPFFRHVSNCEIIGEIVVDLCDTVSIGLKAG